MLLFANNIIYPNGTLLFLKVVVCIHCSIFPAISFQHVVAEGFLEIKSDMTPMILLGVKKSLDQGEINSMTLESSKQILEQQKGRKSETGSRKNTQIGWVLRSAVGMTHSLRSD